MGVVDLSDNDVSNTWPVNNNFNCVISKNYDVAFFLAVISVSKSTVNGLAETRTKLLDFKVSTGFFGPIDSTELFLVDVRAWPHKGFIQGPDHGLQKILVRHDSRCNYHSNILHTANDAQNPRRLIVFLLLVPKIVYEMHV